MILKELLDNINKQMERVQGIHFESSGQLRNNINAALGHIETELGDLLIMNIDEIRLITKDDMGVFGPVGELLFQAHRDIKFDKRVKYGCRGIINSIDYYPSEGITELLNMELTDLQPHFDEVNRLVAIKRYDKEIESAEKNLVKLKQEREKLVNKIH